MNTEQETIYTNEDVIKYTDSRDSVELYIDVAEYNMQKQLAANDVASYNKSSNEENIKNILKNINLEIN